MHSRQATVRSLNLESHAIDHGDKWDRNTGPEGKGSLRLTNETKGETVWSAEPPSQIPPGRRFRLGALARLHKVEGRGLFLRILYHSFEWRPAPHVEWEQTLISEPVSGDTGAEWVTDMDVDLRGVGEPDPVHPVTSPKPGRRPVVKR